CGSKGSGKTHLAHIWQKETKGEFLNIAKLQDIGFVNYIQPNQHYIIENIDQIEEQLALFHIFNAISEKAAYLLLTSRIALNQINYHFLDLASRLNNVFSIQIKEPDFALIRALLIKNFSARQLKVEGQVIDYIAKNIDRRFEDICNIVKMLKFYCFEEK